MLDVGQLFDRDVHDDPRVAGFYAAFVITNLPSNASSSAGGRRVADTTALTDLPGTIACPPDCPVASQGIFVTQYCQATPPAPSVCLDVSTASQCMLGTPPTCAQCPPGAFCT